MKSKTAKAVKPVVFLLIAIAIFFVLQEIFIPSASRKREHADRTIDGLNHIEPGTVDVIFLGSSLVEFGVSSMRLYEKTGICGYSLATSGQPIEVSYWLLKDALRKQSPSVVFLQASSLFSAGEEENAHWRYIFDNYRLSPFKIEMALDYDTIAYNEGWLSALFPMIKYHSRWNALTEGGLSIPYGGEHYALGELVVSTIEGNSAANPKGINANAGNEQPEAYITEHLGEGEAQTKAVDETNDPAQITDDTVQRFLKIKALCDENNAELVLFQIPKLRLPQQGKTWTRAESDEIRELAQKNGVAFYDLQYDADIGLNWATDTCDAGGHLNFRGAEKVADALGAYLLEHFPVRRQSNPQYDAYAARYDKIREVAMLESETDLSEYLARLEQKKDQWSVFVVACDEYTAGMKTEIYDKFEEMGLGLLREGRFRDSYLAVADRGKIKYEAISDRLIYYEDEVDGMLVKMISSGWSVPKKCAVTLDGVDYVSSGSGGRGLNITVYDNESGLVIDSVRFDTGVADNTAYRTYSGGSGAVGSCLSAYEAKVCF